MPGIYSFLQTAYHFVTSLMVRVTKRMYRSCAVLVTGLAVVTVVSFQSSSFSGAGKNAVSPHQEVRCETDPPEEEEPWGELELAEQMELPVASAGEEGQQLLGSLLEDRIQDGLVKAAAMRQDLEEEIHLQMQQAAREEEARKKRERAVISYTDEDYEILKRIVQAEAGVCDEKGRILVANVIINRVKSREFPDNIRDVVYEQEQFSPVSDGTIDTCRVTDVTERCVDRALAGEDYSEGALYFMSRRGSTSVNIDWFDGRLTYVMEHGGHEFFK